jgi:glutathione S-transferase
VIVAARLKGAPFDLEVVIPVVPDNPPANWREISPTGLIPAIEDNGFRLADSTAIIHYLEHKHPTPALLPPDNKELGAALFLDAWAGTALFRNIVHPLFHNQVVNPNIRKVAADGAAIDAAMDVALPEAFGYLESRAPDRFLVGDKLSIADIAVVSNLVVFHYLGKAPGLFQAASRSARAWRCAGGRDAVRGPDGARPQLHRLATPAPRMECHQEAGADDQHGAEPGVSVRHLGEHQVADDDRTDHLGVVERRD